jgi:hypothetical protein
MHYGLRKTLRCAASKTTLISPVLHGVILNREVRLRSELIVICVLTKVCSAS